MFRKRRILILVSGGLDKIEAFSSASKKLNMNVTLASLSDINYRSFNRIFRLKIAGKDLAYFDTVYLRMVGRSFENASLVVNYALKHGLKVVDRLYEKELFFPSSVVKGVEIKKLIEAGIPIPRTSYGSLKYILGTVRKDFDFPLIIKSTSGRKAREVWIAETEEDLKALFSELAKKEARGMQFFAQEFVRASQRIRVLVIGRKVIGAITRPAKWRKRVESKITKENPDGVKGQVILSKKDTNLALRTSSAVSLDVCGVDILKDDQTGESYVIEANAAPSWKLVEEDCGVKVEEEILKLLAKI